jgi:hypothetical protein
VGGLWEVSRVPPNGPVMLAKAKRDAVGNREGEGIENSREVGGDRDQREMEEAVDVVDGLGKLQEASLRSRQDSPHGSQASSFHPPRSNATHTAHPSRLSAPLQSH